MPFPPTHPWHRRKRTWAAVLLWLVVAYPLSLGPALYAWSRFWVPSLAYTAYAAPLEGGLRFVPDSVSRHYWLYVGWWSHLASYHNRLEWERRHTTSD